MIAIYAILPAPSDYGSWDHLPVGPELDELDTSHPDVADGLIRRKRLIAQWESFHEYPHGFWGEESIVGSPELAEAWRNWFLRRAWESINTLNGFLRRWSQEAAQQ